FRSAAPRQRYRTGPRPHEAMRKHSDYGPRGRHAPGTDRNVLDTGNSVKMNLWMGYKGREEIQQMSQETRD
ncbi:hypothetical protein V6C53_19385, partial [Desulfocurvibacter africanus]|uniref:hypothetical protein n=1 Tax=Desulfocurvibacter africanus TaxID=873 RepID=UPI002FDB21BF